MFKVIFSDVGLVSSMQGVILRHDKEVAGLIRSNEGGIAEQAVGQMLRALPEPFVDPCLHYYSREKQGSEAELDYLLQHRADVIPVEVKSGATGSLKSLHHFMHRRSSPLAVRINSQPPTVVDVSVHLNGGTAVEYRLLSIPFYLTQQLPRLLDVRG